jgi:hypothetical protein
MLVTLSGIVIEVREHSVKAHFPMVVTLLGIVIEAREEHSWKASSPMLVTGPSKVMTPWPSW